MWVFEVVLADWVSWRNSESQKQDLPTLATNCFVSHILKFHEIKTCKYFSCLLTSKLLSQSIVPTRSFFPLPAVEICMCDNGSHLTAQS